MTPPGPKPAKRATLADATGNPPAPDAPAHPITLADLSDEDRRALMEEAREAAKTNPTDVEGYDELAPRVKAIRALMDARDHLRDCPVGTGRILGRIEGYNARRPPNAELGQPESQVGVIRCVECGGTTVLEQPLEVELTVANAE